MVLVRKVKVEDPNPSVYQIHSIVKTVVWGLVELVKTNESKAVELQQQQESASLEEAMREQMLAGGIVGDDLPISFGKKAKKSKKKQRQMEKVISSDDLRNQKFALPSPGYAGAPRLDNIYLVLNPEDGKLYPGYCLGVSPSKPDLSFSLFKIFGIDRRVEVRRIIGQMHPVPVDEIESTRDLIYQESWDLPPPVNVHGKYWDQRYRLFSRFDDGVELDAESWFSITPENIAIHIAQRCLEGSVKHNMPFHAALDCFSGCGGNSIALARTCHGIQIISIDIDEAKTVRCRHNAKVYDVEKRIDIVCADVYDILAALSASVKGSSGSGSNDGLAGSHSLEDAAEITDMVADDAQPLGAVNDVTSTELKTASNRYTAFHKTSDLNSSEADRSPPGHCDGDTTDLPLTALTASSGNQMMMDVILLAPPWGGPEYLNEKYFDLRTMIPSGDVFELVRLASAVCPNIVLMIPRNTHKQQLHDLSMELELDCVVEDMFLGPKHKMTVAYLGPLFRSGQLTKKERKKAKREAQLAQQQQKQQQEEEEQQQQASQMTADMAPTDGDEYAQSLDEAGTTAGESAVIASIGASGARAAEVGDVIGLEEVAEVAKIDEVAEVVEVRFAGAVKMSKRQKKRARHEAQLALALARQKEVVGQVGLAMPWQEDTSDVGGETAAQWQWLDTAEVGTSGDIGEGEQRQQQQGKMTKNQRKKRSWQQSQLVAMDGEASQLHYENADTVDSDGYVATGVLLGDAEGVAPVSDLGKMTKKQRKKARREAHLAQLAQLAAVAGQSEERCEAEEGADA